MSRNNHIENMALEDIMVFGKHKGKTVKDVYKSEAAYLVWLRQERLAKNGQANFFNREVNTLLDMTIRESKSLRSKYVTWESQGLLKEQATVQPEAIVPAAEGAPDPAVAYSGWGAF